MAQIHKSNIVNFLILALGVIAVAIFLMPYGFNKTIPGGPYISVVGELIPLFIFCVFIYLEIRQYRVSKLYLRVWTLFLVGITVLLIGIILFNNLSLWLNPHSRGILFGF